MENKCDICEKMLSTKQTLIVHIRTHTGEKPYKFEEETKYLVDFF